MATKRLKLDPVKLAAERGRRARKEEFSKDFVKFCRTQVNILGKDNRKGYVPLIMNPAQSIIHERVEAQRKATGKVRVIILKARQQGVSTYGAARCYWRTSNNNYFKAVVMAHDSNTSDLLFDMTKNFIAHQPEDTRPGASKSSAKELKFKETESSYRVYTAGSPEAGRGSTPTILHGSEVAFWAHDEKVLAGLFQGVADVDDTEIILESTANGANGEFYRLFKDAEAGANEFISIFIPWFVTAEYRLLVPLGFEKTHEEDEYAEKYELDDEQVYWRRMRIAKTGQNKFRQEYPANAEEAFLVSGNAVFDKEKLDAYLMRKPRSVEQYSGAPRNGFDVNAGGHLEIWGYPTHDEQYVIGADVAHGVGQDYSTAVMMTQDNKVVGLFRDNRIDPGSFGDLLFYLGRRFNNALLVVESNGPGAATLHQLVNNMNYPRVYYQTKVAQISKETSTRPGFITSGATKPHIIAGLNRVIREEDIDLPSNVMIEEMKNYIALENGKMEAASGYHDDTVIATALCIEALRTHRMQMNTQINWERVSGTFEQDKTDWL